MPTQDTNRRLTPLSLRQDIDAYHGLQTISGFTTARTEAIPEAIQAAYEAMLRWRAAEALGNLGEASEAVVTALVACLQDEDSVVRQSTAYALGNLGEKSDKILPQVVQWIEQHQDSEYIGYGIDGLWHLVVGGQS
jgi:HEAT repeat protein